MTNDHALQFCTLKASFDTEPFDRLNPPCFVNTVIDGTGEVSGFGSIQAMFLSVFPDIEVNATLGRNTFSKAIFSLTGFYEDSREDRIQVGRLYKQFKHEYKKENPFGMYGPKQTIHKEPVVSLFKDVIPSSGSVTMISGDSEDKKSFIVIDACFAAAKKQKFAGKECGSVRDTVNFYFAAEGQSGLEKRRQAAMQKYGADANVYFSTVGCDITNIVERAQLVSMVNKTASEENCDVGLIVFDTLSKFRGNSEENSSDSISKVIAAFYDVADSTNSSVVFVHHNGKDKSKGARGSEALTNDLDCTIKTEKLSGTATKMTVLKNKDASTKPVVVFNFKEVSTPSCGDDATSLVVSDVSDLEGGVSVIDRALSELKGLSKKGWSADDKFFYEHGIEELMEQNRRPNNDSVQVACLVDGAKTRALNEKQGIGGKGAKLNVSGGFTQFFRRKVLKKAIDESIILEMNENKDQTVIFKRGE